MLFYSWCNAAFSVDVGYNLAECYDIFTLVAVFFALLSADSFPDIPQCEGIHWNLISYYLILILFLSVAMRRRDVVGKVPILQSGGVVINFNFYPGTRCVLCVLCYVVTGGGHDIVLFKPFSESLHCVSIQSFGPQSVAPLQASDQGHLGVSSGGGG